MFAYHVWLWATSMSSRPAASARSTDSTPRAERYRSGPSSAVHGFAAITLIPSGCGLGSPKHRTSTSMRRASSRDRYSTWTPAPPYTSGGYSRVNSATFTRLGSGIAPGAGPQADHEPRRVRGQDRRRDGVRGPAGIPVVEVEHAGVQHPVASRLRPAHLPDPAGPLAVEVQRDGRDPEDSHGSHAERLPSRPPPLGGQAPCQLRRQPPRAHQHRRIEQEAVVRDHAREHTRRPDTAAHPPAVTIRRACGGPLGWRRP